LQENLSSYKQVLVPFGFSDTWRLGFQANTALHGSREGCSAEKSMRRPSDPNT